MTILGVIIGMWVLLYSSVFQISTFTCIANFQPCESQVVIAEIAKVKGENIFRFRDEGLIAKLKAGDYMTQTVTTQKKLPDHLQVEITTINPSFALQIEGGNSWIVCDKEGKVMSLRDKDPNVPVIITSHLPQIRIGAILSDEKLLRAGQLVILLREQGIVSNKIIENEDYTLELHLKSGLKVIMTSDVEDLTPQISALQQALTDSTIKKEGSATLDVRFAQPILKQN